MKFIAGLKERVERLFSTPGEELGRWARLLRYQIQLWKFCVRRLRVNNAMAMSAALSFRTIFTLVPVLVLMLLIVKAVAPPEESNKLIDDLLHKAGITEIVLVQPAIVPEEVDTEQPASEAESKTISAADEIRKLIERVEKKLTFQRVGPIGMVLLIWTALTLLTTMERSLNRIFGARRSRGIGRRVLLYWSVLTLGPILLLAAKYVQRQSSVSLDGMPFLSWIFSALGWLGPILTGILLLGMLYTLLPNVPVRFQAALWGAMAAVPLWLLAKWGFGVYVREVVGKGSVYGALGLLPIFLLWLNLSWTFFLFGAEIANTTANLSRMVMDEQIAEAYPKPLQALSTAVLAGRWFQSGKSPITCEDIAWQLNLPEALVQKLLDHLVESRILCAASDHKREGYSLSRPAEDITAGQILEIDKSDIDSHLTGLNEPELKEVLRHSGELTRQSLAGISLADLIKTQ